MLSSSSFYCDDFTHQCCHLTALKCSFFVTYTVLFHSYQESIAHSRDISGCGNNSSKYSAWCEGRTNEENRNVKKDWPVFNTMPM